MSADLSPDAAVDRFRALLRFATVSLSDPAEIDWAPYVGFRAAVAELYPGIAAGLELTLIDGHSMVFRWVGHSDAAPSVLMAHYDVVPASDEGWQHPPFAAELTGSGAEATIWARGALDDKGALVTTLEAVEAHLAAGFVPANDVYLCFGHNEEVFGSGAIAIVEHLRGLGVTPALVLDEGGAVVEGIFPGVTRPIAVVGVSEKGIMTLRLTVRQPGGHASTPPRMTATARLARAIDRIRRSPFPVSLGDTNREMIRTLGAHASGPLRWASQRLDRTGPALAQLFGQLSDETSAMVRTTAAVTQLSGAMAANALPEHASATVNVRIGVDSSVAAAVRHLTRAVRDAAVAIEVVEASEPSATSPTAGPAWELLRASIESTFDDVIVTPYVMLGASDARTYTRISEHVYRFSPFDMSGAERGTLHAQNERIRVDSYLRGIEFYRTLIRGL